MAKEQQQPEELFSKDKRKESALNLDEVSGGKMNREEFTSTFISFLNSFYSNLFRDYVIFSWLLRNFTYFGRKGTLNRGSDGMLHNLNLVKFIRRQVGKDVQIVMKNRGFSQIESYFEDFFPNFMSEDPFKNPDYYKFPYKNITLDFLPLVYQMEDRLALLQKAEDEKMTYATFAGFVIKHIDNLNEKLDIPRFLVKQETCHREHLPFCIMDTHRYKNFKKI